MQEDFEGLALEIPSTSSYSVQYQIDKMKRNFVCEVEKIPGDGNCLFRAITKELKTKLNVTISHSQLRNDVVLFLLQNVFQQAYQQLNVVVKISEKDIHQTLLDLSRDRNYGGAETLYVVCAMFGVNVFVINFNENREDRKPHLYTWESVKEKTLTLLYYNELHYDMVLNGFEEELEQAIESNLVQKRAQSPPLEQQPSKRQKKRARPVQSDIEWDMY